MRVEKEIKRYAHHKPAADGEFTKPALSSVPPVQPPISHFFLLPPPKVICVQYKRKGCFCARGPFSRLPTSERKKKKKTRRGDGGLAFAADLERLLRSRGGRAVISTVDFITHPLSFLPRRRRNRTFIISRQEWERHDLSRAPKRQQRICGKKGVCERATTLLQGRRRRHTHPKMCRGGARRGEGPLPPPPPAREGISGGARPTDRPSAPNRQG